jgi:hypothetical protein
MIAAISYIEIIIGDLSLLHIRTLTLLTNIPMVKIIIITC